MITSDVTSKLVIAKVLFRREITRIIAERLI